MGKETGLKCEGKLRDAKRFTPTTVCTPGGCVLATRDGTLLPGVKTILPATRDERIRVANRCLHSKSFGKMLEIGNG